MQETDRAKGYLLCALIEDVRIYENAAEAPAYQILVGSFGVPSETVAKLVDYVRIHTDSFAFYPELSLIAWELRLPLEHPTLVGA